MILFLLLAIKSNLCLFYSFFFRRAKTNPVEHVKDILIQEIMTLEKSAFEQEAIDMDSISFAGKTKMFQFYDHLNFK